MNNEFILSMFFVVVILVILIGGEDGWVNEEKKEDDYFNGLDDEMDRMVVDDMENVIGEEEGEEGVVFVKRKRL